MDSFRTEEEQVEALKKWWQENGKSAVLGIVLAIAGVFSYRLWERQSAENLAGASQLYQLLLDADQQAAADSSQLATGKHLAERLQQEHGNKVYGLYAGLFIAKYEAMDGNWSAAEEQLRAVLAKRPEPVLAQQVQLRLAQVIFGDGRHDQALEVLGTVPEGPSRVLADELAGDILMQKGESGRALASYRAARETALVSEKMPPNPVLDMKIEHLEQQAEGGAS